MPGLCRMNKYIIQGLIWLYIFSTGLFVVSLEPGYLDFDNLPDTNFSCVGKVIGGYYADLETNCQMFHVCTIGQLDEPMDIRFLCLNGTVFDQETRVCERIDEVDCSKSEKFYSLNLELYGNTAPPILEENPETEYPIIEKASSTTTTTTTTTTTRPTTTTTARTEYFTSSARPVTPSPYHKGPSSHLFSIEQPPSYTPEEINISLNAGAPPNIRTKTIDFSEHNPYSDNVENNNKKTVTTSSSVFKSGSNNYEDSLDNSRILSSTTESERNSFNPNLQSSQSSQNNFKYNFNYHDTRPRDFNPSRTNNYQYHHNFGNFRPPVQSANSYHNNPYRSSTQRNEYLPVSRKNFEVNHPSSTSRSFFLQPIKSPSQQYFRTEKPEGNQLPVPVLPTISPIVFSSPAPFALSRHVETKRYTDEHELPPRIIISASASVSDASGRTLNYSLGTIGAAQILAQPPASYDDYKEEDVVLDPFYHDVPKLQNNGKRTKRDTSGNGGGPGQSNINAEEKLSSIFERSKRTPQNINPTDIIRSEEEAVEVLKFLFDWYKRQEKSTKSPINIPVSPELISNINEQFSQRPYVPEDYEDDQAGNLEKSIIPDQQEIDPSDHSPRRTSQGNSLLHQASRGPSSNINSNERYDIRNGPIHSSYEENNKYEGKIGAYLNNYHTQATPPSQELVKSSDTKNKTRGRPNRGRHRFTFPYATTPSQNFQETFTVDKPFDDRRIRVQNPSLSNYEEFYERQTKNNNGSNYKVNNDTENSTSQFERGNIEEYEGNKQNVQYSSLASPVATTQKPLLKRFDEIYEHNESVTERSTGEGPITVEFSTQDNPDSVTYAATTNNYFVEDHTIETDNNMNITNVNAENLLTKSPDYTYYDNDFVSNKDEKQKTTNNVHLASTEPYSYIDTYEYTDDNYEPAIFIQNSEEEQQERNGIIHEETHVNIDLTETPEDSTYENETQSYSEETTTQNNAHLTEANITKQSFSSNETSADTNRFKPLDKNITSFGDILNSLRNFQKYEQDIYNYHNNLTEIKEYDAKSSLTTRSEEVTTPSSSLIWETTPLYDQPYTHDANSESKKSQEMEEDENVSVNATEEQNISNETDEESASSTRYLTVATDSYNMKDEPELFTSRPINIENRNNDSLGEVHNLAKYEISETEIKGTTAVSIDQFTYPQDDKENDSVDSTKQINEDILPTRQENSVTESITPGFEIKSTYSTQEVSKATKEIENPLDYTTVPTFLVNLGEKGNELITSSPKPRHRGRNRSRQRPSESSRRRVENIPVSNYYRETTGRRRNSRRRQQNKPFYNLEALTETQLIISTTPMRTSDDVNTSEIPTIISTTPISTSDDVYTSKMSTISTSVTGNVLNSTPKGFYITKIRQETEYTEEHLSSTDNEKDSFTIVQSTEQNDVTHAETQNAMPQSTQQTIIVPQSTQHTIVPQFTEHYTEASTNNEKEFSIIAQSTEQNDLARTKTENALAKSPQFTEHYTEASTNSDFSVGTELPTELPTQTYNNFSEYHISVSETTENIFTSNTIKTELNSTLEETTEARLSGGLNNFSTESSEVSTNLTEDYISSYIELTNRKSSQAREDSSEITEITTDISSFATTNDATRTDSFVPTAVPTLITYSTLSIGEIEVTTNSIFVTQSASKYKKNYVKNNENSEHNEDSVSTESTTETTKYSTFSNEELTTEYQTESTDSKEAENLDHTTQTYSSDEKEITVSDSQQTTKAPSTKLDIITEVNFSEYSTQNNMQNNEDIDKKPLKSSLENEIDNEQSKVEAPTNRDGRKYDRRKHNQTNRHKSSGSRFSSKHRFSSIHVTPRPSGSRRLGNSKHRFGSTPEVTQKTTSTNTEIETAINMLPPETPNIQEKEEEALTEITLPKNVKPTLATIKSKGFSTTPMLYKVELRKEKVNKHYVFNCFGKPLYQFYSDPRDCRLFHYCTNGYSKNQLLDMKFVCDLGTHFDDEKLVCTREIPKRCL